MKYPTPQSMIQHSNSRFVYLLKLSNYSNRQVKPVVAQVCLISNVSTTSPSLGFYHAKQQPPSNHPSVTRYFAIVLSIRLSDNNDNNNNLRSQVCLRLSTSVQACILFAQRAVNKSRQDQFYFTIYFQLRLLSPACECFPSQPEPP